MIEVIKCKKCSKCKEVKDVSEFYKDRRAKDGFLSRCKACQNKYYKERSNEISDYNKIYSKKNKIKVSHYNKKYYDDNKSLILEKTRIYKKNNREKLRESQAKYNDDNRECIYTKNRARSRVSAKYESYKDKLTVDEAPRLAEDGVSLEVKCRYCGKYFIPTNRQISRRVNVLNDKMYGTCSLYCSSSCKSLCPIYGRHKYPKGFKHTTAREVNPIIRQMCFEEDNWECQICGKSGKNTSLHCHHILGYAKHPQLGNDIDNVITLCKECHKKVHSNIGCRYVDLQKNCPVDD